MSAPASIRDRILALFEPDVAVALIEFGKSLAKKDVDIFVFLARKSLCLYDVLLALGVPPITKLVVSDRVLDMDLAPFRGKRVALVDDTLIVGTSLAKARERLENDAGASVQTHVFCTDRQWHSVDLIRPNTVALELPDERVMTFCTAEVRAMSVLPRPYLVDFPITTWISLSPAEANILTSSANWFGTKLTTPLQDRFGVSALTFFPTDTVTEELRSAIGPEIFGLFAIIKVRAFSRNSAAGYQIRLVPIVTFKPIHESALMELTTRVTGALSKFCNISLHSLVEACDTSEARMRLMQHVFSAAVGHHFVQTLEASLGYTLNVEIDSAESERHFGPWFASALQAITGASKLASFSSFSNVSTGLTEAPVPESVITWATETIGADPVRKRLKTRQPRTGQISLLADFTDIFRRIYDMREVPARKEAKKLGRLVLADNQKTPNLDRLAKGIPWNLLVQWMLGLHLAQDNSRARNVFSLLLDLCNDIGVSVPVTCIQGGVLFRGYRHGEDVKFSDAELVLAYEASRGFLDGSRRQNIPRLHLEKLLVLLLKVGLSNGFMEPVYGPSGAEGICRIGFDLMGARAVFRRGPRNRGDSNTWLAGYLVNRAVLKVPTTASRQYMLGEKPDGNFVRANAPNESFELGYLVGQLCRSGGKGGVGALTEQDLTLLATCATPAHMANAVQVELDIFLEWFSTEGRRSLSSVAWTSHAAIEQTLKTLRKSHAYIALFSGCMKVRGFRTGRVTRLIKDSEHALRVSNPVSGSRWEGFWKTLLQTDRKAETERFDPFISRGARILWDLATCISAVEIALVFALIPKDKNAERALESIFEKFDAFRGAMREAKCPESKLTASVGARFSGMRALQQTQFTFAGNAAGIVQAPPTGKAFSPESAVRFANERLNALMDDVTRFIDELEPLLDQQGRFGDSIEYSHLVYYDIIDSTATTVARTAKNVEAHRRAALDYKRHVNTTLSRLTAKAESSGAHVFCQNGHKSSTNDCKHIFFSGVDCDKHIQSAITSLLSASKAFLVCVRIIVIPCGFAGSLVSKHPLDPDVEGERFWEHFSRVHKQIEKLEPKGERKDCFVALVSDQLSEHMVFTEDVEWCQSSEGTITSEIAGLSHDVTVKCGTAKARSD